MNPTRNTIILIGLIGASWMLVTFLTVGTTTVQNGAGEAKDFFLQPYAPGDGPRVPEIAKSFVGFIGSILSLIWTIFIGAVYLSPLLYVIGESNRRRNAFSMEFFFIYDRGAFQFAFCILASVICFVLLLNYVPLVGTQALLGKVLVSISAGLLMLESDLFRV